MYRTDEILNKINDKKKSGAGNNAVVVKEIRLTDIMLSSLAEVKELTGDILSSGETEFLYNQAQQELKENIMAESRILSRANPQLARIGNSDIRQSAQLSRYDDLFPQRASKFVKPGDVASMFSPAGYLTELYREARSLHPEASEWRLDRRRPDLAALSLSQRNMDEELSTLAISNELLLKTIQTSESLDYDGVMQMLSTCRQTGNTPFHWPYEATRQAILLQDKNFTAFRRNPEVARRMDRASLLSISSAISPDLRNILTEEITEKNMDELLNKNFGNIDIGIFTRPNYLAKYYSLTDEELNSFLGMVSYDSDIKPDVQYYNNDRLVALVPDGEGRLEAILIKRTDGNNAYQFGYAELIPVSKHNFVFNFTIIYAARTGSIAIGTNGYNSNDIYSNSNQIVQHGVPLQVPVTLTSQQIKDEVDIGVTRIGGGYYASAKFYIESYPFGIFLLKLNKLIRLYKASGVSPADIRTIIESNNNNLDVTEDVLRQVFWVRYYMQIYGVDVSSALVLAGAEISQIHYNKTGSAFDRLFNTPPLNNRTFYAEGTSLNLKPGSSGDSFQSGVLKRAFQVNDSELYLLYKIGPGENKSFTTSVYNISLLYQASLLATINNISVTELSLLLALSPYAKSTLDSLSDEQLSELISFIDFHIQWIGEQKWTISDLYLMLTNVYSTELTPDIENFITTLKSGLANEAVSEKDDNALIAAAAPLIAAATQLNTTEVANAILRWVNQLKPQNISVRDFLTLILQDRRQPEETTRIVAFCQVLGQLALIARNTDLREPELSLLVNSPELLGNGKTILQQDIATLYNLTRFHDFITRSGSYANEIITALANKNLSVETVARATGTETATLAQALQQVSDYSYFYNWSGINSALEWLDVATTFAVTPADIRRLVDTRFSGTDPTSWQEWVAISDALQAGLIPQQTLQLQRALDTALSAAVSAWVIKNAAPSWVTDRDKLYSWMLIDNQVSPQINTTRLAEAIASVQLYVNRALNGQEEGVVNPVKSRQFFMDWDTYNKRYSTWAGVSKLVYYPENYIDPTLRIGQTGMMNEMLQSLSQSQLTSDTVEDAFKTYLTRFEEIANLDVISGYHDSTSEQTGITYIIGRSAIGDYYWRSVDINKFSGGKLPANAWREWRKITAAINPVNNLVRPVFFQSRLYLVWVESREAGKEQEPAVKETTFWLNYSHILHDGTWSGTVAIPLSGSISALEEIQVKDAGFYCASNILQDKLYIFFYTRQDDYQEMPDDISGLYILSDGSYSNFNSGEIFGVTEYIFRQFDSRGLIRLNTPYVPAKVNYQVTSVRSVDFRWGDGYYTIMANAPLPRVNSVGISEQSDAELDLNVTGRIVHNGYGGAMSRSIVNIMREYGTIGDAFYAPEKLDYGLSAHTVVYDGIGIKGSPNSFYINVSDTSALVSMLYRVSVNGNPTFGLNRLSFDKYSFNFIEDSLTTVSLLGALDVRAIAFSQFRTLDTTIQPDQVQISIAINGRQLYANNNSQRSVYTLEESLFNFNRCILTVPASDFRNNNTADINITVSANAPAGDGRFLGSQTFTLTLLRQTEASLPVISLNRAENFAQYLQFSGCRIRVNTLFAKQLVARANAGINTILSIETQQLQEPKLGMGSYVEVVFTRYNKAVHGEGWYELYLVGTEATPDNSRSRFLYQTGNVSSQGLTRLRLFLPYDPAKGGDEQFIAYIGVRYSDADFSRSYLTMQNFTFNPQSGIYEPAYNNPVRTRGMTSFVLNVNTEPMDFSGANALYFWEMFYYVPMMVFRRLLSESRFTEATRWIKYVWAPEGYLIRGAPAPWQWNVRPLEEESSWNADPLVSVDPDAVAQADPLHYKVATFMGWLDLLIARGDRAYRQLERDTLNEAKMWYVQALDMLGSEPWLDNRSEWGNPLLSDAADRTRQIAVQQAMLDVRQQGEKSELRMANSLIGLFLPQQNEKLSGYWQTLAQRLHNLRNNLSIDGQPLSLAIYAKPADPAALLAAAAINSQGGNELPAVILPVYRFPALLNNAQNLVNQLIGFGNTLLGIIDRQDAEALAELLLAQGGELVLQSIALQDKEIAALDADRTALEESRAGAQSRLESYSALYEEDINRGEKQAMDLALSASVLATTATTSYTVAAGFDVVPNIYGMAFGGSRYGAIAYAVGTGIEIGADASRAAAERISQSEAYRRRRQEWEIQCSAAQADIRQTEALIASLEIRREGAVLQKNYLETQQRQTQAEINFLQNKFSNKALYNWLRGKLAAIYYQFYDLAVSRCLMAERALQWEFNDESKKFIRPGNWQGTYAGLMAGETLMLNLSQMEQLYLEEDKRALEVTRTVCLSEIYAGLSGSQAFSLADKINEFVAGGNGQAGTSENGLKVENQQLQATLKLSDLAIASDFPSGLGSLRRIKQIGVTLPALVGPYQDVRAVLSYGGSIRLPQGCTALALSHGLDDSGQFQLDFDDPRWLPFEGIPVDDSGTLTLLFPDADNKQKTLLLSLTDIILHIRYTIL